MTYQNNDDKQNFTSDINYTPLSEIIQGVAKTVKKICRNFLQFVFLVENQEIGMSIYDRLHARCEVYWIALYTDTSMSASTYVFCTPLPLSDYPALLPPDWSKEYWLKGWWHVPTGSCTYNFPSAFSAAKYKTFYRLKYRNANPSLLP